MHWWGSAKEETSVALDVAGQLQIFKVKFFFNILVLQLHGTQIWWKKSSRLGLYMFVGSMQLDNWREMLFVFNLALYPQALNMPNLVTRLWNCAVNLEILLKDIVHNYGKAKSTKYPLRGRGVKSSLGNQATRQFCLIVKLSWQMGEEWQSIS